MNEKLVSIIVPIYNIEQYLDKCISSILAQSYKDLEIILVDDGSTDNSGAICEKYALEDDRIRVVHKTNGGLVSARKEGIRIAQGQYIGFVDGDDFIEKEMYEALVYSLEEQAVDFIHSGYIKSDDQQFTAKYKRKYVLNDRKSRGKTLKEIVLNSTDAQSMSPSIWSKLFKRKFLTDVYMDIPDNLSYGEDLLCLCSCIVKCDSFGTLPEAYYHYIKREQSICNERKIENIQRETELYKALRKLFKKYKLYSELKGDLERFYLRNLLGCLKQLTNVLCPVYQYPAMEELAGKKVLLYGAGEIGQDYYTQFCRDMRCVVTAVSDKHKEKYHFDFIHVIGADEIINYEYDVIVVAVLHEGTARAIQDELAAKGIGREKILWKQPQYTI